MTLFFDEHFLLVYIHFELSSSYRDQQNKPEFDEKVDSGAEFNFRSVRKMVREVSSNKH